MKALILAGDETIGVAKVARIEKLKIFCQYLLGLIGLSVAGRVDVINRGQRQHHRGKNEQKKIFENTGHSVNEGKIKLWVENVPSD